jgi:hypothetical protein
MSLRNTCTAVADRQRCCGWGIPQIGKAVAEFREGCCGFCRGGCTFGNVADGLKESATTKSVRPIENHACSWGTCYHVLRYAAQRRTLNPPVALPVNVRSAAGRRTLRQSPFRRENRFKSLPGNAPRPIILRSAAGRRTLNPPVALPVNVRSAAGWRTLRQRPFRRENRFKSLPGNAPKPIILRSASGRRTLNPPVALPGDVRSAAGRRILKQNNAVLRVWSFYLGQGFRSAGPHLKIMKQKMMTCSMKLFCMGQRNAPSPHHPMG